MRLQKKRITLWNSALYFLLIQTLNVRFTEGLTWSAMPLQINKCKGQTANLTWKFIKEGSEEIRQLQWFFNTTQEIASWTGKRGFKTYGELQERVKPTTEAGILIHSLSDRDVGNYTLNVLIERKNAQNRHSFWLNVIEPTTEPGCTCATVLQDLRNGRMLSLGDKNCTIQINSTFCCVVEPTIQYCESNPQNFCSPINLP